MKKFRIAIITKFVIGACLILAGVYVFCVSSPGTFYFFDFPGLIYVVLGGVAMTLMGFSFPEIGSAFKHALGSSREPGKGELEKSVYFWEAVARNFFLMGVLMTVIGYVILLKHIHSIAHLWNTLASCFITTVYGLILGALGTIAGLRVSKKIEDLGQSGQDMEVNSTIQRPNWNIEKIIGIILFITTIGFAINTAEALLIFIHWPSLLIVAGGAIFFVICAGNGEDGLSTTLSFAFTGVIGILFGVVQMLNAPSISGIAGGMTIALLSCVFALLGMMLGGVHRQDYFFKRGKTNKKITISRISWYGFPIVVIMLIFYTFLLIMMPITKKT